MEKSELGKGEDVSKILDLFLVDHPYNMRSAVNGDDTDYIVFAMNNMKPMAKALGRCGEDSSACTCIWLRFSFRLLVKSSSFTEKRCVSHYRRGFPRVRC